MKRHSGRPRWPSKEPERKSGFAALLDGGAARGSGSTAASVGRVLHRPAQRRAPFHVKHCNRPHHAPDRRGSGGPARAHRRAAGPGSGSDWPGARRTQTGYPLPALLGIEYTVRLAPNPDRPGPGLESPPDSGQAPAMSADEASCGAGASWSSGGTGDRTTAHPPPLHRPPSSPVGGPQVFQFHVEHLDLAGAGATPGPSKGRSR
jgi:hypothetical protein